MVPTPMPMLMELETILKINKQFKFNNIVKHKVESE